MELTSVGMIKCFVAAGLGVALISASFARNEVKAGVVKLIPIAALDLVERTRTGLSSRPHVAPVCRRVYYTAVTARRGRPEPRNIAQSADTRNRKTFPVKVAKKRTVIPNEERHSRSDASPQKPAAGVGGRDLS